MARKNNKIFIVVKKARTGKWLPVSDSTKRILLVSPLHEGKTHDFAIFKSICARAGLILDFTAWQVQVDSAFLGIGKQVKTDTLFIPFKASENRASDEMDREYNGIISSMRVRVEHAVANLKSFFILRIKNRMRKRVKLDDAFGLCAALANFRLNTLTINT